MRRLLALLAALVLAGCTGRTTHNAAPTPTAGSTTPVVTPTTSPTATPATSPSVRAASATRVVVVRPVRANGQPAAGFRLTRESSQALDCTGSHSGSEVAVSDGIAWCSPAYVYAVACWHVLGTTQADCFRDPWKRTVVRMPLSAPFPRVSAPRQAEALGLVLDDGRHCSIRDGGAWNARQGKPDWWGSYSCNGPGDMIVWSPSLDSRGINRSSALWTVVLGSVSGRGPVTTRHVVVAYVVGSAP